METIDFLTRLKTTKPGRRNAFFIFETGDFKSKQLLRIFGAVKNAAALRRRTRAVEVEDGWLWCINQSS